MSFRLIELADGLLRLDPPEPNPMSGMAVIRFAVPFAETVALELLDAAAGRHSIVDAALAAGVHEVMLDASSLASGVYEVRLRVGEKVRSRRVVVVR
jgi:hypothetical protein